MKKSLKEWPLRPFPIYVLVFPDYLNLTPSIFYPNSIHSEPRRVREHHKCFPVTFYFLIYVTTFVNYVTYCTKLFMQQYTGLFFRSILAIEWKTLLEASICLYLFVYRPINQRISMKSQSIEILNTSLGIPFFQKETATKWTVCFFS